MAKPAIAHLLIGIELLNVDDDLAELRRLWVGGIEHNVTCDALG